MTEQNPTTRNAHWPTCRSCETPDVCRSQDECGNYHHSLFRMWEYGEKQRKALDGTND